MSRPFTFDRVVRIIFSLALIAGAVWLVGILKNVLLPFCLACLLSYILEPFVECNQQMLGCRGRVVPVFVTLTDAAVTLGLLVYLFMPGIMEEVHELAQMVSQYSTKQIHIPFIPDNITDALEQRYNLSQIVADFENGDASEWLDKGENILSSAAHFLMHSLEWLLTFIYVIFILIDYENLGNGAKLLIPVKYKREVLKVCRDIKESMNRYFRSQMLIAACAAVFYTIGFSIVGIPLSIVLGLLVGLLYMIPYFQYVTIIPVVIVCFISSLGGTENFWTMLLECGLVYVVSQCICDYILTPKIMGKSMGLNPAVILLSLSVWGTLMGIIGMIIALPMTALLTTYYKSIVIDKKPLAEATE